MCEHVECELKALAMREEHMTSIVELLNKALKEAEDVELQALVQAAIDEAEALLQDVIDEMSGIQMEAANLPDGREW